jgi:hypothetical protein
VYTYQYSVIRVSQYQQSTNNSTVVTLMTTLVVPGSVLEWGRENSVNVVGREVPGSKLLYKVNDRNDVAQAKKEKQDF